MADRLLGLCSGETAGKILEFGCGTGLLTRKMRNRFPAARILATDASASMLEQARRRCGPADSVATIFSPQDASGESPPEAAVSAQAPFDLIASNALVQWFPDLAGHFRFAAGLAKPGGHCLVSGFSQANFPELNSLLAEPPFAYRGFPGHDPESVPAAAASWGWSRVRIETWEEIQIVSSPLEVLRKIQTLGSARDPKNGGKLNRRNLDHLLSAYSERFGENGGVRMTWKPWAAAFRI
jgi:malonyl-CoA O-methyltransferase